MINEANGSEQCFWVIQITLGPLINNIFEIDIIDLSRLNRKYILIRVITTRRHDPFSKSWQYFLIIEDNTSMNNLISANKTIKSKLIHSMDIVDNVWHWFTSLFKTIKLKKAIPAQCYTTCKKNERIELKGNFEVFI